MNKLEAIAAALETFDRRLSAMDARFAQVECYLAEDAQATEEGAKSVSKLAELYVSIDERLESLQGLLSNYVAETAALRLTSRQLVSEVRDKLKAANG